MVETLYGRFVRHGQCQDNANDLFPRPNSPLTRLGERQARDNGRLLDVKRAIIYASPLDRTVKTAEIIGDEINAREIVIVEDLKERDMGVLAGAPIVLIDGLLGGSWEKALYTDEEVPFPPPKTHPLDFQKAFIQGEEPWSLVFVRSYLALEAIAETHDPDMEAVIVGHSGSGKAVLAICRGEKDIYKALSIKIEHDQIYPIRYKSSAHRNYTR